MSKELSERTVYTCNMLREGKDYITDMLAKCQGTNGKMMDDLYISLRDGAIAYDGNGFVSCHEGTPEVVEKVVEKIVEVPTDSGINLEIVKQVAAERHITPQSVIDGALRLYL